MDLIPLGASQLQVTPIGYGCMAIGGSWDEQPISNEVREKGFAAIDQARACGINFFDHADIYCRGKSETVFGDWLQEHPDQREDIVIQSKCGICLPQDSHPQQFNFSYEHICKSVDDSLARLRCDHLDVLVLHRPDPLMEPQEVARAFSDLQQAGKVHHFGVSNQTPAKMRLLQSSLDQALVCNQIQLSLMHHYLVSAGVDWNINGRGYEDVGCLEYCLANNICVQAWSPLARGFLDGRPADTSQPDFERIEKIQTELKIIAHQKNCSSSAVALAWLMRLPTSVQAIIGTCNPDRIKTASAAAEITLDRDDWYRLYHATREFRLP